jgi:oxygen-independent coproporphyrinogen-3 oxidase
MAMSETMFLGLRLLQEGVSETEFAARHRQSLSVFAPRIKTLIELGLLEQRGERLLLTRRGRLLSNQVFVRFLS